MTIIMMKTKAVHLTEQGADKAERMFKVDNLYDVQNVEIISHINTALRACNVTTRCGLYGC